MKKNLLPLAAAILVFAACPTAGTLIRMNARMTIPAKLRFIFIEQILLSHF